MKAEAIIGAVRSVTGAWAKQRKSEERRASSASRRRHALLRGNRCTLKNAAYACIPDAYMEASDQNTLPTGARQIMYAARGRIQEATGEQLDDKYFTQTLLPGYLREHPETTGDWDVVFDARGHFHEPHTGLIVPLGTLDVRGYLAPQDRSVDRVPASLLYPTRGPENRFSGVFFVEKEGFWPLFQRARLAERFDLAIMSTKGMSVVASRTLVDHLCGDYGLPLFVLHDFDKAGFSILGTLRRDTDRYTFRNRIEVVDLGLRLEDVEKYSLEAESVQVRDTSQFRSNLRRNGATESEIEFLAGGERVELNAMISSGRIIEWIEGKLQDRGLRKLVPRPDILETAFRQAVERHHVEAELATVRTAAGRAAREATIPDKLTEMVTAALRADPALPWDLVVSRIAASTK